jgi:hypothetical protein
MREIAAASILIGATISCSAVDAKECEPRDGHGSDAPALRITYGVAEAAGCESWIQTSAKLDGEDVPLPCVKEETKCTCEGGDRAGSYEVTAWFDDYGSTETVRVEAPNCELETVELTY